MFTKKSAPLNAFNNVYNIAAPINGFNNVYNLFF